MQIDLKVIDKGCLSLSLSLRPPSLSLSHTHTHTLSQEISEGVKFMSNGEIHNKGFSAKRTGKILERNNSTEWR